MGDVFEAEHLLIGSRAAIKVLHPELSVREETVSRFFTEARAAALARHPGLVEVMDFGHHDSGAAFLVMELLEGETLSGLLARRGPLPAAEAVLLARQVATAMAAAHHRGVVHRDLKPDNLYLTGDPDGSGGLRVKVLDFGVAKLTAGVAGATATRTGQLIGTPLYMAPEQCHGASHVDARADIYSLGCILYHMICGRPPFFCEGAGPVIAAHLYELPPPLSQIVPTVPPRVEALCLRLLEKSPELRPQTMAEVDELLLASISAVTSIVVSVDSGRVVDPRSATVPVPLPSRPLHRNVGLWWGGAASLAGLTALAITMNPFATPWASAVAPAPAAPTLAVSIPDIPLPRLVTLRIDSRPADADVTRVADGAVLGRTPLSLIVLESDDSMAVRVRKAGYLGEELALSTASDGQVSVVLARRSVAAKVESAPGRAGPRASVKDGALDPYGD